MDGRRRQGGRLPQRRDHGQPVALNDILDLAKVESGTVTVELSDVPLTQLCSTLLGEFEPVAQGKDLGFTVELAPTRS